ncbi:hypothetical protein [Parashewanella spongiae]|uniref:hypothetical protein n=1 Tax=Parashewanella spongiae TaxID=342950 RepID=UPI000EF8B060|nr:hypothetical protein [Parashewanella spongiae]
MSESRIDKVSISSLSYLNEADQLSSLKEGKKLQIGFKDPSKNDWVEHTYDVTVVNNQIDVYFHFTHTNLGQEHKSQDTRHDILFHVLASPKTPIAIVVKSILQASIKNASKALSRTNSERVAEVLIEIIKDKEGGHHKAEQIFSQLVKTNSMQAVLIYTKLSTNQEQPNFLLACPEENRLELFSQLEKNKALKAICSCKDKLSIVDEVKKVEQLMKSRANKTADDYVLIESPNSKAKARDTTREEATLFVLLCQSPDNLNQLSLSELIKLFNKELIGTQDVISKFLTETSHLQAHYFLELKPEAQQALLKEISDINTCKTLAVLIPKPQLHEMIDSLNDNKKITWLCSVLNKDAAESYMAPLSAKNIVNLFSACQATQHFPHFLTVCPTSQLRSAWAAITSVKKNEFLKVSSIPISNKALLLSKLDEAEAIQVLNDSKLTQQIRTSILLELAQISPSKVNNIKKHLPTSFWTTSYVALCKQNKSSKERESIESLIKNLPEENLAAFINSAEIHETIANSFVISLLFETTPIKGSRTFKESLLRRLDIQAIDKLHHKGCSELSYSEILNSLSVEQLVTLLSRNEFNDFNEYIIQVKSPAIKKLVIDKLHTFNEEQLILSINKLKVKDRLTIITLSEDLELARKVIQAQATEADLILYLSYALRREDSSLKLIIEVFSASNLQLSWEELEDEQINVLFSSKKLTEAETIQLLTKLSSLQVSQIFNNPEIPVNTLAGLILNFMHTNNDSLTELLTALPPIPLHQIHDEKTIPKDQLFSELIKMPINRVLSFSEYLSSYRDVGQLFNMAIGYRVVASPQQQSQISSANAFIEALIQNPSKFLSGPLRFYSLKNQQAVMTRVSDQRLFVDLLNNVSLSAQIALINLLWTEKQTFCVAFIHQLKHEDFINFLNSLPRETNFTNILNELLNTELDKLKQAFKQLSSVKTQIVSILWKTDPVTCKELIDSLQVKEYEELLSKISDKVTQEELLLYLLKKTNSDLVSLTSTINTATFSAIIGRLWLKDEANITSLLMTLSVQNYAAVLESLNGELKSIIRTKINLKRGV